jgi:hypothetical protein
MVRERIKAQLSLFPYYGSEQCIGRLAVDYLPYSFLPFFRMRFKNARSPFMQIIVIHFFIFVNWQNAYANKGVLTIFELFCSLNALAKYAITTLHPYVSACIRIESLDPHFFFSNLNIPKKFFKK